MDQKEKLRKELIKKKRKWGGRSKQMETPKNDRKTREKAPKSLIINRSC